MSVKHPAKYSRKVLEHLDAVVPDVTDTSGVVPRYIDPFAGVGGVHWLARGDKRMTVGVEIEPEWAKQGGSIVGDSTRLREDFPSLLRFFDGFITSVCYANRMADNHVAKDKCKRCDGFKLDPELTEMVSGVRRKRYCKACGGSGLSKRNTYTHTLGRKLTANNAGAMQWGDEYRQLHIDVYDQLRYVLTADNQWNAALGFLNISDHIRDGARAPVAGWHLETLQKMGWLIVDVCPIVTRRQKNGANRDLRVDAELVVELHLPKRKIPR